MLYLRISSIISIGHPHLQKRDSSYGIQKQQNMLVLQKHTKRQIMYLIIVLVIVGTNLLITMELEAMQSVQKP